MIYETEREKMQRAHSIGPKMIQYLEDIGIETLEDLRDENAYDLCARIDEMLGKKHLGTHKMVIEAFENLIELANNES